jgi:arsenate reductase-like glutaredoxin family protein
MEIVSCTTGFDFKTISLADPHPLNGQPGYYFTRLIVGDENKSLCLQLPECLTKQGVINVKNAQYVDLMLERAKNDDLMRWIEQLEYSCQDIIDSKKDLWFQTELTRDDIETMMTQITRLYQSGNYILVRSFIDTNKATKCIAYDENEIGFDLDTLESSNTIIPLIMIEGVKFSSRSFEIVLKLVQVMVIGNNEKKSSCLIKRKQDKLTMENTSGVLAPPKEVLATPKEVLATPKEVIKRMNKEDIEEVNINYDTIENETISLKNPNDVYYELYNKAKEKAKKFRKAALNAYLEAKQIRTKYMLYSDEEESDGEDFVDIMDDIINDEEDEEEEDEDEENENENNEVFN